MRLLSQEKHREIPPKDESLIPPGLYCYTIEELLPDGRIKIDLCPYWDQKLDEDEQESGYCHFIEEGDGEDGTLLLWDQCKECGVNMDIGD